MIVVGLNLGIHFLWPKGRSSRLGMDKVLGVEEDSFEGSGLLQLPQELRIDRVHKLARHPA